MAKNQIQFQYGLSLSEFQQSYGTEDQCYSALFHWRWPDGFRCPLCGSEKASTITSPNGKLLKQCYRCHHQTSITAGTIFESTKLPLTTWFLGMYFMTQDKKGVSAMELHRLLGISYNAAWRMKQKLMQVMLEREESRVLSGWVEVDDAYLGGQRHGGKVGRGSENKTPFIAAVSTTEKGHPIYSVMSVVPGFFKEVVENWSKKHLEGISTVISDGLPCFNGFSSSGHLHDRIVCGGGVASVEEPEFQWVNTLLGNLKSAIRGTYHAISPKYAQRYLAEFQYRFNRRFNLKEMLSRLAYRALRTPPMPKRLLELGLG